MADTHPQTTSFTPNAPVHRAAGGKFRKPPRRPPPSTPYARPPLAQQQRGGRWLSKLVDPAFRLIAGGATLIFPSFFFKSQATTNALPAPSAEEENHDNSHGAVGQPNSSDDGNFTTNHVELRATGVAGDNQTADRSNRYSDFNGHKQNQKVDVSDPNGLSEIEQLMKDKKFSRDEIDRLIEIINSRALDLPDVGQGNKYVSTNVGDLREPAVTPQYSGKSTKGKQEDISRTICETSKNNERKNLSAVAIDAGKAANALGNSKKTSEGKHEDLDRLICKAPTHLLQSKLQDDVGASPVEIARAYMGNRTSELGFGANLKSKDEATLPSGNELALKPFIPSPAPMSSPFWPGALVQTPQSQQRRFGLYNFPRTPYSRTIYSKTKSKLIQSQGNSGKQANMMATPLQQTQTPSLGQVNSRGNTFNDSHGSVGPIRRTQHKVTVHTPRGSPYFHTSSNSQGENFNYESLFSTPKTSVENGGTSKSAKFQSVGSKAQSSEVSVPTVPPHSSLVARKILEHLERNPPTPKDKSTELRLATSWKKPQPSDINAIIPNKLNSLTHLKGPSSFEKFTQIDKNNPQESSKVAMNNKSSALDMKVGAASTHIDRTGPAQDFRKPLDSQLMDTPEDVTNSKIVPNAAGSEVFSLQKKLPPQTSGTRPVLPSISINKASQRWTLSSDNNSAFTFPVSASSGASSEPPTPSIMPSSASIDVHRQNEQSSIPSYSFGSRKSTPTLVFSFPSTSSASIPDGASDLKFSFGSDDSTRISFGSIGQNAVCY